MKRFSMLFAGVLFGALLAGGCGTDDKKSPDVTADTTQDQKGGEDAVLPDGPLPDDQVGEDLAQPDGSEPETGTPDVGEPDTGTPDVGEPDTGTPDVETTTGTVSLTGTLALDPVLDAPVDNSMFIIILLPPGWEPSQGDPAADILAVLPVLPGPGYSGAELEIPVEGNMLHQWDPNARENPVLPDPYQAEPGDYILLAAFQPDMDASGDPSHVWFSDIEISEVPTVLDIDAILVAMGGEQ